VTAGEGSQTFVVFGLGFIILGLERGCVKVSVRVNNMRTISGPNVDLNLLQPTGYVMHQQFNIQQLYALPTLYLCVLYLSENKQRLVPLTA